ncbi:hypothetical protein RRG08_015792, partial [Elysia crispata]
MGYCEVGLSTVSCSYCTGLAITDALTFYHIPSPFLSQNHHTIYRHCQYHNVLTIKIGDIAHLLFQVDPNYLHANSTAHIWIFGAFEELI